MSETYFTLSFLLDGAAIETRYTGSLVSGSDVAGAAVHPQGA